MKAPTKAQLTSIFWAIWIGFPYGLVLARLGYELNPLQFGILGALASTLALGLLSAGIWGILLWVLRHYEPDFQIGPAVFPACILWLHILANSSDIQPLRGEILLGAITIFVLLIWIITRWKRLASRTEIGAISIGFVALLVYLQALQPVVGRADTFEFQTTAPQLGIAHPTGYPLFLILGKLFSLLPFGTIAARVNLTSAAAAVVSVALLYFMLRRTLGLRTGASVLAVLWLAFSPVMFSQSVEAEVYTLDAAFTAGLLILALSLIVSKPEERRCPLLGMAALMGFSLTNHITTVTLIPPLILTLLVTRPRCSLAQIGWAVAIFCGALCLYLYIPIRWAVINHAPMPLSDFFAWITASRFSGALQLRGWLNDPERWRIIFRILQDQFSVIGLTLAGIGLISLCIRKPTIALITGIAFAGELFFCLNYYVPDIAVFMIPLFLISAIWIAVGIHYLTTLLENMLHEHRLLSQYAIYGTYTAIALLLLIGLWTILPQYNWRDEQARVNWGNYTLSLPIAPNAVVLADSEKIAPLEYLHSVEGLRPDITVSVLPTEQAYRDALYNYLNLSRPVYLARQLPGLEGIYHLRSMGDLIEVGTNPLLTVPDQLLGQPQHWQNGIKLLGYHLDSPVVRRGDMTHLTLYWQSENSIDDNLHTQLRILNPSGDAIWQSRDNAPVNGWYPTNAWKTPEIIPDYYGIPIEQRFLDGQYTLQLRLTHPFERDPLLMANGLDWISLGTVQVQGAIEAPPFSGQRTAIAFPDGAITAVNLPAYTSAENAQGEIRFTDNNGTTIRLIQAQASDRATAGRLFTMATQLPDDTLRWEIHRDQLRCGWLLPETDVCQIGTTTRSNIPATTVANFENKIALTNIEFQTGQITPGGTLQVTLQWQPLQKIDQDYTVFVHFLGPDGRLHGQIDQYPIQGTYPTSAWKPGETILDHYSVPVSGDAPQGNYRLEIGFYLLSTGQRLLLFDVNNNPTGDVLLENGLFLK